MYVIYVYKNNFKIYFCMQIYKLIKLLTFTFDQRYSPSETQPINLFTEFWKFSNFKPIKKKVGVTLILPIIAKEKSDQIAK